jgi:hypothetical protein
MDDFRIKKHTDAERDEYLVDCFHDAGFIQQLIGSSFSIIAGRKGSGKTAIARYLEQKHEDYNIDYAFRMSLRNIAINCKDDKSDRANSILQYI